MATYINSSIEDVQYHLDKQDFNGPLDLLVKMVQESKINVLDIFVSDITKQYVDYVKTLKELDYEYVSEYITFAATLVEIKSSKVLPPDYDDDEYNADIRETERQLISDVEKAMLLQTPDKLKPLETLNLFYPEPMYDEDDYNLVIKSFDLDKLIKAFQTVLERYEFTIKKEDKPKTIQKERFTVAERIVELAGIIRTEKKASFYNTFLPDYSKLEIINTFLAILELLKNQVAVAMQDENSDDIFLTHSDEDTFSDLSKDEEILKDVKELN